MDGARAFARPLSCLVVNVPISVLLVGKGVAWAASMQRTLAHEGMTTYFVMGLERAQQAARELEPDVVVVCSDVEGRVPRFFRWLQQERPEVGRVLLTALSKSLFRRDVASGLVDAVAFERDLVQAIGRVSLGVADEPPVSTTYVLRRAEPS